MKFFVAFSFFSILFCSCLSFNHSDHAKPTHNPKNPFNSAEFDLSAEMGKPGKVRKDVTTHHPGPQGTHPPAHGHGHPPAHGHGHPPAHGPDTTKATGIKGNPASPPPPAHHDVHHKANNTNNAHHHPHHDHKKNNASQYSVTSGLLIILSLLSYFL